MSTPTSSLAAAVERRELLTWTGSVTKVIGGVDISWQVGPAVICPAYYGLTRLNPQRVTEAVPAEAMA